MKSSSLPRRLRRLLALCLLLVSAAAASACSSYARVPSVPAETTAALQTIYLLGDAGVASEVFDRVTGTVAAEIARDARENRTNSLPAIVLLGDNLYESGLPRPIAGGGAEQRALAAIAERLTGYTWRGQHVVTSLVPGNHDYDQDALSPIRTKGDIARWFYLEELGLGQIAARFRHFPGKRPPEMQNSSDLYDRIYASPAALAHFMAPARIDAVTAITLVAIDSELLIELFDREQYELADEYLAALRHELRAAPAGVFRAIAAHHPLETYAKHRPGQLGRFLLGPGWPQFTKRSHYLLALPPLGTLATLNWWAAHFRQDVHDGAYERYRRAVFQIMEEETVALFFAGHDHCTQIIDLGEALGGMDPGAARGPLLVVTGEGAKRDPTARGRGTIAYHTGGGFVRAAFFEDRAVFEVIDAGGEVVFRYAVAKSGGAR